MKALNWLLLSGTLLFTFCKTPQPDQSADTNTALKRMGSTGASLPDNFEPDTSAMVSSEFVPLLGRSETGVFANLEGSWVLKSIKGVAVPGNSNLDTALLNKRVAPGTELRRDSVVTRQKINGVEHTVTTVEIDRMGNPVRRLTPPQGDNFHNPDPPSINFYGSNETFSGYTGCNKFAGRYVLRAPDKLNLRSAASSTKMVCIGDYDEEDFINTLHKVDNFKTINGELHLMQGDTELLVFTRKA